MNEIKKLYNALKSKGDLNQACMLKMTGSWEKDKFNFTREYEETQALLNEDLFEDFD